MTQLLKVLDLDQVPRNHPVSLEEKSDKILTGSQMLKYLLYPMIFEN